MVGVLVYYCYRNKLSPNWWQETTQIDYHIAGGQKFEMGLTGLKSKSEQGCVPSGTSSRESVSLSFLVCRSPTLLRLPGEGGDLATNVSVPANSRNQPPDM